MRSIMARMLTFIGLMSLWAGDPARGAAPSAAQRAKEALDHVTAKQSCRLNTDIVIALEKGQAQQLDVQPNPYGLEKYVLYYYAQADGREVIRGDAYLADGERTGGGSWAELAGALRQTGYTPCLAIIRWKVRDGRAQIELCLSDDIERNHREYRQCALARQTMSAQYNDRQLVPAMDLPETDRLAGFVRLWSEVKYNFAFFSRMPDLNWDKVLVDYLPQVQAARTDVEYYQVLRRCMALLRDGHSDVEGPAPAQGGRLPFLLEPIEGMAVMTAVSDANATTNAAQREQLAQANLKRGEAVTHINGRAIADILKDDIYPYICASTPQGRDLWADQQLGSGPFGKETAVRVKALDGSERQVTLTCGRWRMSRVTGGLPDFRDLSDGILYFKISSFGSDDIVKKVDANMDRICAGKGLILDLRYNGGGDSSHGDALLSRMTDKPLQNLKWKTRQYVPAHRAWGRSEQWCEGHPGMIQPREGRRYTGPVVVLVGPATCSAAEDFVAVFQCGGRGKVIGQPTNGSTGQPLPLELPGGGRARICTKWDTYPDGREFVGIGCIPEVEVVPTRADIAAGRDVVLEKAVTLLRP